MTKEEIQKLKLMTMKPPIFSSMNDVHQMRYDADCIKAFGLDGRKTPSDKFLEQDLRRRADRLERELFVESLTSI